MRHVSTKVEEVIRLLIIKPIHYYVLGNIMTMSFHLIVILIQPMTNSTKNFNFSKEMRKKKKNLPSQVDDWYKRKPN